MKTKCLCTGLVLALITLFAVLPVRADQDLSLPFSMPSQVHTSISSSDCDNSHGPTITISGTVSLGGYTADLIFKNNKKGTKTTTVVGRQTAILLEWGSTIDLPKQPTLGGVGGNPYVWLQFFDDKGNGITDQIFLGRCVQGFQVDPSFLLDVVGQTHVHADGCSNKKGPYITLDSNLTLASGLNGRLTFSNRDPQNGGEGHGLSPASVDGTVDIALLISGTPIELPKQPVDGGVGGNPLIYILFKQGDGTPITDEIFLGRCTNL